MWYLFSPEDFEISVFICVHPWLNALFRMKNVNPATQALCLLPVRPGTFYSQGRRMNFAIKPMLQSTENPMYTAMLATGCSKARALPICTIKDW